VSEIMAAAGLAHGGFYAHLRSKDDVVAQAIGRMFDAAYANRVIGELVASHRAVAPSRGIDLVPIVRHCLKARNMQLTRDVLLTTLLIIGLLFARSALVLILVITFMLSFLPGPHWERRSVGGKMIAVLAALSLAIEKIAALSSASRANVILPVAGSSLPTAPPLSMPNQIWLSGVIASANGYDLTPSRGAGTVQV